MRNSPATDRSGPRAPSNAHRAELLRARSRLTAIWDALQAVTPSAYERPDAVAEVAGQVARLLGELSAIVAQLMATCDALTEAHEAASGADKQLVNEARALADTCFMVLAETNERHEALLRLPGLVDWEQALSRCAAALRRARKGASSVDAQLARTLCKRPSIDVGAQLEESLETRRLFSVLRRVAEGGGQPDSAQLRPRLRAIELRISLLSEKDLYLRLRLEDRRELESLRSRIEQWLAAPDDTTSGLRLWQDAVGFTQLLGQVNLRQELREHDQQVVDASLDKLERLERRGRSDASSAPQIDESVWTQLRELHGLSDELDELLRRDDRSCQKCLAILRGLADSLRPSQLMALPGAGRLDW